MVNQSLHAPRAFAAVFAALMALLANAPRASAQDSVPIVTAEADELSSINTESGWATALYVTSVTEMVASVPLAFIGGLLTSGCSIGGGPSSSCDGFNAMLYSGLVLGALGLLTLPIAIGLDVDSGSRRRGVMQRALNLSPTPSGLVLSGTF